ncbi:MAG: flagellar biosynthetic protein FliO [Parashewanella sp.]
MMNTLMSTVAATTSSALTTMNSTSDTAPSALGSLASMLGGLVVVLLLIFVLAYFVRRFNLSPSANGAIKTLAVTPLGQKEKLVLIDVDGQQYLVGVTPNQISLIDKINDPITIKAENFASKLRQAKVNKKAGNEDAPV